MKSIAWIAYRLFVISLLFVGAYLTMRFGMNIGDQTAKSVSVALMLGAFVLWWVAYRGKKFK